MPPALPLSDEEDYASEEDSDFAPDAAPALEGAESASDDSGDEDADATGVKSAAKGKAKIKSAKRKRGEGGTEEAEDAGFENSGDEAIIEKGLKRQKKKSKRGANDVDDEGGEGGLIKTRSMRAQEKVEKKPLVDTIGATVDVDSLWEAMITGKPSTTTSTTSKDLLPTTEAPSDPSAILSPSKDQSSNPQNQGRNVTRSPSTTLNDGPDSMIMIKRTYNFAGKVHTEEKLVARGSAEAKLYLATQKQDQSETSSSTTASSTTDPSWPFTKPKRPPKLARRSLFEPLHDLPPRTDLHFGIRRDASGAVLLVGRAGAGKEKKLNTVEKSAMDWAGFVDKEGIKDDLEKAGKSKGAYRARQEFLARVEEKREAEERKARGL